MIMEYFLPVFSISKEAGVSGKRGWYFLQLHIYDLFKAQIYLIGIHCMKSP
jgi:hypothetical protein